VREQVDAQVASSEEVLAVVTALEGQYDAYRAGSSRSLLAEMGGGLPTADELGDEFERFLADQADGSGQLVPLVLAVLAALLAPRPPRCSARTPISVTISTLPKPPNERTCTTGSRRPLQAAVAVVAAEDHDPAWWRRGSQSGHRRRWRAADQRGDLHAAGRRRPLDTAAEASTRCPARPAPRPVHGGGTAALFARRSRATGGRGTVARTPGVRHGDGRRPGAGTAVGVRPDFTTVASQT
jgi:hypothetical protein